MCLKKYLRRFVYFIFLISLFFTLKAYSLATRCELGCFEANTRIYSMDPETKKSSYIKISEIIFSKPKYDVISLNRNSKIREIKTKKLGIRSFSQGKEKCSLIVFETVNGQSLAVTQDHPILLSNGKMIAAKNIKKSDFLVQADGNPVAIQNIGFKNVTENVLNILTNGNEYLDHTLIAEGLIVGDMAWQNDLKSVLNKKIME